MTTVFVVNPKAGKGNNIADFADKIRDCAQKTGEAVEIYFTQSAGDACDYVKNYCLTRGSARFIACGGDGTLNEVLNGAIDCAGAEIGVVPIGTGNDFCRNFSPEEDFDNIEAQLAGTAEKCDAIRYTTWVDGEIRRGYCVNMFNIGFDCNVADMTAEMKKKPLISGSTAYFLSILVNLIKKKGANLEIELDGEKVHSGPLLLTSVANGSFCGGGIMSNPLASVQDGLININIVNNVSRMEFIGLLPHYMKGDFLSLKNIEKVIRSVKCTKAVITPLTGAVRLCIDGEIADMGKTEFEIVHNAFNFVLPASGKPAEILEVAKC